jgi:quercetin dioxygenase-like cupin family protein
MEPATIVHGANGPGRAFWGPGDEYTFLITGAESGGSMFSMDCRVGAGGGPPPHKHLAEDELFFIYAGEVVFTADGATRTVRAGESIFVPRGVVHCYRNESEAEARMVAVYTPAGMEGWFLEVCTPVGDSSATPPPVTPEMIERMLEAGPRYNVEWAL